MNVNKTPFELENDRMREASGTVASTDRIETLLYLLARDDMPLGHIEQAVEKAMQVGEAGTVFTNGWLAMWAKYTADKLKGI